MVVDEGLTRTWLRWTIHRRSASMRLGLEAPDVMEKSKWMLNRRNQATLKGSHIFEYQSLLNLILNDLEIKCENWSYGLTSTKSQALEEGAKGKVHVATLMKMKRKEVARFIFMQAQVEEGSFLFYLKYRHVALSREMLHILQTKSHCNT
jgi:hypothetical protein